MRAFRITAAADVQDAVLACLWELGTAGVEERPSELVAYFEDDGADLDAVRRALTDFPGADVQPTDIPQVDWVARFREGFRAFAVGDFWITPAWDTSAPPPGLHPLVVDPGRAFGTGTHESTALCLEALSRTCGRAGLGRVADVGTGSGILAVAALQLGAASVIASDVDPESIEQAARHLGLNGVHAPLVQADGGRAFASGRFDTVIANITGPLLVERASELAALARLGGRLILAGLLASERDAVSTAYAPFGCVEATLRGEWAGLVVERR